MMPDRSSTLQRAAIRLDIQHANFYEKALFVKGDVATAPGLRQLLCPSRYASIRTFGELTLSLVARCIGWDPSWFGLLTRIIHERSGGLWFARLNTDENAPRGSLTACTLNPITQNHLFPIHQRKSAS